MNHLTAPSRLKEQTIAQDETIESSRRLWTLEMRRKLSKAVISDGAALELSRRAAAWLRLNPRPFAKVAGVSLGVPEKMMEIAWLQVMEWECGRIEHRMLRYLTGYRNALPDLSLWPRDAADRGSTGVQLEIEGAQVDRVSRSLLNEIGGGARCRPVGSFRVDIPENTPLSAWGVTSLRIWIDLPDAMWVAFEKGDEVGPSVRWSAAPPHVNRWMIPCWAVPSLHLTLSALWRDLCLRADSLKGGSTRELTEDKVSGLSRARFAGRFAWEPPSFLMFHHRVVSQVNGHLRRLPYGRRASLSARIRARRNGIARLPPGTTFVRPHRRSQ